jgi:hypothetical protein
MSLLGVLDRSRTGDVASAVTGPISDAEEPPSRRERWRRLERLREPETLVTLAVVVIACVFVFLQLQPSKLFSTTTPAGGDMGAHVWQPAYLRDHLLPHWRLTGWAPDWYAGFPALVFYFPLPMLLIVIVNLLLPYGVAFKLVSVCGLVGLPIAAWAFGRLSRMRFPGPACLAAATLPFLFSRNFTIYGGNIASTLAGEFAFSIALVTALVFLGLVARGLETGRYRGWAAALLLVTGLCHLLPTVFAVIGAVVLTVMRRDRRAWRWTAPVLAVAGLLAAFWALPFVWRLPYATDMGYEKVTQYVSNLFPRDLLWLFILAGTGALVSIVRRQRVGVFLTIMTLICAVIFRYAPQARLWNARVLPFWFLCLYLLAGVAVAEVGSALIESLSAGSPTPMARWSMIGIPAVAMVTALVWVSFPLRILPFGSVSNRTGQYHWLGITTSDKSFIPDWVKWNYSGYQSDTKARRAEYFALVKTMADLGKTHGCGRAMWEYESEEDQMGTPMALMLLPYWTHGCIASMEGLYFESSATTPYHFLNAAELSLRPSNPVRGLNYPAAPDVNLGVQHLQLLGVKYYMAITPETQVQADKNPNLKLVASSGPWPVTYYSGNSGTTKQRTWSIYEVENSDIVSPLSHQPVVMKGVSKGGKAWLIPSQLWYLNPNLSDVLYAASGPRSWQQVSPTEASPPRTPLPPVQVANIKPTDDSVSFDVDKVGVPVLVKVSYFPNWHVSGARGPYRVTPNLMVVIPTSHHVRLHYGYTPVDEVGMLLSLAGIVGLVWLFRAKPVQLRSRKRSARGRSGAEAGSATAADPYLRLEHELSGAFPVATSTWGGPRTHDDLDVWLGFPAGLDLAHYHTSDYGTASRYRPGGMQETGNGGDAAAAGAQNIEPYQEPQDDGKEGPAAEPDEGPAATGPG